MPSLSWVEIHGAITHLPVAFLLAVPVFEIGALLLRKPEWRIVSFWLLAGAVLTAVPALITGWVTGNDLKFTGTPNAPPTLFLWHRLAAFTTSGLAILLLLWRITARDRLPRQAQLFAVLLSLVTAGAVGFTGYLGGKMVFGEAGPTSSQQAGTASEYLAIPSRATKKTPEPEPQLVAQGQTLFTDLPCQSCHHMNGKGGRSGPDLTHEAQRHADINWHIEHLRDPQQMKPGSDMPSFDNLPPHELKALAAYLATLK